MRVYTEAVQFKADQKLITFIEKKLTKMETFFGRIIDARVVLKLENSGQVRDKVVEVRLNLPGETLIVKESHKSFEGSIENATNSLKRKLIKYKEKLRPR